MKLEIANASFSYPKREPLFENVSFTLKSGDIISVLGPNGAGKTTLLRALRGILRWTAGASMLDDEDISSMTPSRLWSKISYVPQAHGISGSYTVLESVLFGMTNKIGVFSTPKKKDIDKALSILGKLQLAHLKDRKCNEISGGELQMTLIARALASDPGIIILDEPESNLDFKNQIIVLDTLSQLASKGVGVLFNTHFPEHALRRSNKALLLNHGQVLFGPVKEIITEQNIQSAFGVKAVIGSIETENNQIENIIPVALVPDDAAQDLAETGDVNTLASITIICEEFEESGKINSLLHEYNDILFGRMGMPHRSRNVYMITVNLDGPKSRIEELAHALSLLPDVSCKVTYAKEKETRL